MSQQIDLTRLWNDIAKAGGIEKYVEGELSRLGYVVRRRPTEHMSKRVLKEYKASLKREAAERKKLKKQAWDAYFSSHIVHLGDGVYFNDADDFDRFDVIGAEERCQRNEMPDLANPKKLAEALELSISELRWFSFHREAAKSLHYTPFSIPKRNGKSRQIWAPMPKLKKIQHWILRNIAERMPIHGAAHGFVAGRSIASNARRHCNARIVIKMDIKDFFPTVTWRRVKGLFRKAGYRDQIATLLSMLCTEAPRKIIQHRGETYYIALGERCLPQGAPTSPALTNALCRHMDVRLTALANKLGWRYTRYADDLSFSLPVDHEGEPKIGSLLGGVKHIVAKEGFEIHPEKTRVMRNAACQQITGLVVNGEGGPRVPRKRRRQIRAALHNLKNGKSLKDGESVSQLIGWIAFIHMTQPELAQSMLAELDQISLDSM